MNKIYKWQPGDRFSYIRKDGKGWAYGTVLERRGGVLITHLDCQQEGETYRFTDGHPRFLLGELGKEPNPRFYVER